MGMRDRLAELNLKWESSGLAELWQAKGFPKLHVRVGLHSGTVVAGNLGSETRMKYAVTGDTVNLAARLEQLNKQTETSILMSSDLYDRLPDALKDQTVDRGAHQVKGREQSVQTFSI